MHAAMHKLGSSDPLDIQVPFIRAKRSASISITADTEFDAGAGNVVTNDRNTFAWDSSDRPGLLIKRSGTYLAMAAMRASSGTVERSILIKHGLLSGGTFPGGDFGSLDFYLGDGQGDHDLAARTATSGNKSMLNAIGMQTLSGVDPTDPYRVVVLLNHTGSNFTLIESSFYILRIGTAVLGEPPEPPA